MQPPDRNNVYLVGFMAAGKSALAPELAVATGRAPADTDAEIERRAGMPVEELFRRHGEPHFRALEREVVRDFTGRRGLVVASGGGCFVDDDNRRAMLATGTVIYLQVASGTLAERLQGSRRPLIAGLEGDALRTRVARQLALREPWYREAHLVLPTGDQSPKELAKCLEERLRAGYG